VEWGTLAQKQREMDDALRLFRSAADQEQDRAQNHPGALYNNGQGAQKDNAEAEKWFRKAAEKGFPLRSSTSVSATAEAVGPNPQKNLRSLPLIAQRQAMVRWIRLAAYSLYPSLTLPNLRFSRMAYV